MAVEPTRSKIDSTAPPIADGIDHDADVESELYARHVEVENLKELVGKENQRGTPIPALFNQFYKFIQNPSTVSVETFKRMIDTDDTIGSGIDFLTTCLAARLGRYQHPSEEITEWVNKALNDMEGGWFSTVKKILSATWAGYMVGEKVWQNTPDGFTIKKIVSLPPTTLLFETDRTGEITFDGILQYQRNYNPIALSQGIGFFGGALSAFGFNVDVVRPDVFAKFGDLPFPLRTANQFNYLSIRIPKLKCIHYSFDAQGNFENPYGRSLLRRAYKYYVLKDAILQMMAIALDRKGTPLTVVFADPNTTLVDPTQAATTGVNRNVRGRSAGIPADRAAKDAFANIHNDSVIILPGKKGQIFDLDWVEQHSNAQDFIASLDFCNKSIMRAILIPALIFGTGDGSGSWALGQEHSKTFNKILDGALSGVAEAIKHQVVKELLAYNFPRESWEKEGLGSFTHRDFSQEELDKIVDMYEKGINSGIIDQNDLQDLNKMRDTMGFEPREEPIEKPMQFGVPNEPGLQEGEGVDVGESEETKPTEPASKETNKETEKKDKPKKSLIKRMFGG